MSDFFDKAIALHELYTKTLGEKGERLVLDEEDLKGVIFKEKIFRKVLLWLAISLEC